MKNLVRFSLIAVLVWSLILATKDPMYIPIVFSVSTAIVAICEMTKSENKSLPPGQD